MFIKIEGKHANKQKPISKKERIAMKCSENGPLYFMPVCQLGLWLGSPYEGCIIL